MMRSLTINCGVGRGTPVAQGDCLIMRVAYFGLLVGLVVGSVPAFSQPKELPSVEFEGGFHTCAVVERNDGTPSIVCSAREPIPLYSGPPQSIPFLPFFLLSPDETGTVQQGTEFSIGDRRTVDLLGERSRWLLLQTPDGSDALGWTYAGSAVGLSNLQIHSEAAPK